MKRRSYLSTVTRVTARLRLPLELKHICQIVVEALTAEFGAVSAELWLSRPAMQELYLSASHGPATAALVGPHTDSGLDAYLTELKGVVRRMRPVIIDDASRDFPVIESWMPAHATAAGAIPFSMADGSGGALVYYLRQRPAPALAAALAVLMTMAGARIGEARARQELRAANRARDESLAILDAVFSAAPVGLAFLDSTLRCQRINETLAASDGIPAKAHLGRKFTGLGGALGRQTEQLREQVLAAGAPMTDIELAGETSNARGEQRHWLVNYYPIRAGGEPLGVGAVVVEITERKKIEELLRERNFLEAVLHNLKDGIVACDARGDLVIVNQMIQDFRPSSGQAVPPDRWADHYGLFLPDGVTRMSKAQVPLFRALAGEKVRDAEMVVAPKDGPRRVVLCNGQPIFNGYGRKLGAVVTMHDVTERKRWELRLADQVQRDPLTGLFNRRAFEQHVRQALARMNRRESLALLFLDLDRLKSINDSHGHEAGDRVLIVIARRLMSSVRTRDVVARLGGDEFVVLCEDLDDTQEAVGLARRIEHAIAAPLSLQSQGIELTITVSAGIAFAATGETPEAVLRRADGAMYQAKRGGGARHFLAEDDVEE